MAVFRKPPKCPKCGEAYKGIHYKRKGTFVGDTFIRWNIEGHVCKKVDDLLSSSRIPGKDSGSTNQTEKTVETSQTSSGGQGTVKAKITVHNGVRVPYVGAVVILHLGETDQIQNNFSREMPAIITRVWSDGPPFTVNLKGLPDGTGTIWRTSVMHQNPYQGAVIAQNPGWRWPDEELARGNAPMEQTD